MFNFLDSNLSPKVVCSSPAMDSYEVENLISNTFALKLRGFMVYPAIKPPVEIEFEFLCPVNIHYISLNTTVGSQKCNGIEIFAKSKDVNYTSIGRAIFNTPGIIFGNGRMYSRNNSPEKFNKNFEIRSFKGDTFKLFLNASSIKVVIFRTDKSVPCLGSVEVWGIPSRSCSQVTVDTISRLAMKSEMRENTSKMPVNNDIEELSIPEDFKDDLTCEIMSLPMTLPSGKSIDQTTLEKHIQGEKSFGRKPGDPFTGINFTDKIKPVLNVALKSRIDMFILQNSHREDLFSLKRTLGGHKSGNELIKRKRGSSENITSDDPLERSIDRAKRNPSYINFTGETDSKTVCLKCKIQLNFLYKISCDHFYCRKCLLDLCDISRCEICEKPFTTNEINKVNL